MPYPGDSFNGILIARPRTRVCNTCKECYVHKPKCPNSAKPLEKFV